MVKKATRKKAAKNVGGRPKRDPASLRSERLVLRIHPDLMECLTGIAAENGLTRSLIVERAMVTFINNAAGEPILDSMGRRLAGPTEAGHVLGSPASFDHIWSRVIGVPSAAPAGTTPQPPKWARPGRGDKSGNPDDDGV